MGDMNFDGNVSASGKHDQVMELFDFVFESSKENVRKPDPDFYLRACERGNVDPADVTLVHFIDTVSKRIKGSTVQLKTTSVPIVVSISDGTTIT